MGMENRTALVTGASRGIGKAIALAFAKEKMNVVVCYHHNKEEAEKVCREIHQLSGKSSLAYGDLSILSEVDQVINQACKVFGNIDVLVNNAGIIHTGPLDQTNEDEWDKVMDVNLKSAFLVTQRCLPMMRSKNWGRIINISSVAAQTGGVTSPIYVASKAGMIGLTHSYASLLAKEGITSNAIAPALIDTDMLRKDLKLDNPEKIPIGRFGLPSEVADVALMLVKNSYITGQTININGGWYFSS